MESESTKATDESPKAIETGIKIVKNSSYLTNNKVKTKEDVFFEKMKEKEVNKIKFLQNFDEIVAVSNLNTEGTIEFIKEEGISSITFVVDPNDLIRKSNNFPSRYEAIVNKNIVQDLMSDPTLFRILGQLVFLVILLSLNIYFIYTQISIFMKNTERDSKHREQLKRNALVASSNKLM